jgi:hypothetical protein
VSCWLYFISGALLRTMFAHTVWFTLSPPLMDMGLWAKHTVHPVAAEADTLVTMAFARPAVQAARAAAAT